MNNYTYIILAAVMIFVVASFLVLGMFSGVEPEPAQGTLDGGGPFGGSPIIDITPGTGTREPGSSTGQQSGPRMSVKLAEGELEVIDITKEASAASSSDGVQIEFSQDKNDGYELYYFPNDLSFLVVLLREPVGEVRKLATEELISRLGISEAYVCALVAEVVVDRGVSDVYTGYSLGFPGCPGATALPGD